MPKPIKIIEHRYTYFGRPFQFIWDWLKSLAILLFAIFGIIGFFGSIFVELYKFFFK